MKNWRNKNVPMYRLAIEAGEAGQKFEGGSSARCSTTRWGTGLLGQGSDCGHPGRDLPLVPRSVRHEIAPFMKSLRSAKYVHTKNKSWWYGHRYNQASDPLNPLKRRLGDPSFRHPRAIRWCTS